MPLSALVELCHFLGDPRNDLAILAEGNASARCDERTFWVKGSGYRMRDLGPDGLSLVQFGPILNALDSGGELDDEGVKRLLMDSLAEPGPKPSTETFFHAFLLSLPDVNYVGHTHATPVLALTCLEEGEKLASTRLYPDEVVCCGPESVWVPYVDPGLPLSRALRDAVLAYVEKWAAAPKTVWMQNHGLIALGSNPEEVESASLMAVKAARVYLAALAAGTLRPMEQAQVERIHSRPDEAYRIELLKRMKTR